MSKFSAEDKVKAVELFLNGIFSVSQITNLFECDETTVNRWIAFYRQYGPEYFLPRNNNNSYTVEFKEKIVREYLSGEGSLLSLAVKYKVPSKRTILDWINIYNANMELKDYIPAREVYMADSRRKTTIQERLEIVQYCIDHNMNYKETARIFNVSYSQVYDWVRKYKTDGKDGLQDRRGLHKSDDEVDEVERLKREVARLKRELKEKDMLAELLKKVRELEGK